MDVASQKEELRIPSSTQAGTATFSLVRISQKLRSSQFVELGFECWLL